MSEEMKMSAENPDLMSDALSSDALSDDELEDIAGGAGSSSKVFRKVAGLKKGYLALRTAKCYDYKNEIRGHELYNGDLVQVLKKSSTGSDGRPYTYVRSLKDDHKGYVNSNFLKKV